MKRHDHLFAKLNLLDTREQPPHWFLHELKERPFTTTDVLMHVLLYVNKSLNLICASYKASYISSDNLD